MNIKELNYAQKKTGEELQLYLHFKKRGFSIPNNKGKGSMAGVNYEKVCGWIFKFF